MPSDVILRHLRLFRKMSKISNCWLVLCLSMLWPSLVVTELFFTYLWFLPCISFFTTFFVDQPLASSSLVLSAHQSSNCCYFLNHSSVSHKAIVLQFMDFHVLDICIRQCMYLRVGKKSNRVKGHGKISEMTSLWIIFIIYINYRV